MSSAAIDTNAANADPAQIRLGLMAAGGAYLIWGLLPLYLKLLAFAQPAEVLAVRVLWTVPTALAATLLIGGWRETATALKTPGVARALCLSAVFIGVNWWVYVWAVANSHVIEASLAYFLAPLVAAGMGIAFFGERLARWQIGGLAIAAIGVGLLALAGFARPGAGSALWVTIALCASWSAYAFVRKRAPVPAAGGLFAETLILAPIAAGWVAFTAIAGAPLATLSGPGEAALLALAGPITATPLILFALGARRLRFSTLGLLQYVAPSMQFALGVAFGEQLGLWQVASFALIWTGLAAFSFGAIKTERRS